MGDSSVNPPSNKPPPPKPHQEPKDNLSKGGSPMFQKGSFMGMPVTKNQMKQIMNNMCKMILSDIKKDQKRMQDAMKNIKKAAEGEPI